MNIDNFKARISKPNDAIADELLVDYTARKMENKLKKKRGDGFGGWWDDTCSNDYLETLIHDHLEEGDWIDVINLAAMINMRTELYKDDEEIA